jgi:hypothetical protein
MRVRVARFVFLLTPALLLVIRAGYKWSSHV